MFFYKFTSLIQSLKPNVRYKRNLSGKRKWIMKSNKDIPTQLKAYVKCRIVHLYIYTYVLMSLQIQQYSVQ